VSDELSKMQRNVGYHATEASEIHAIEKSSIQ
jgi:hypothetical protein